MSQALRLKPDIVLINISVLTGDWSKLVKQIIEELPRTLLAAGHAMKEIAYRLGYIDAKQLRELAKPLASSEYGQYLAQLVGMLEAAPAAARTSAPLA